MATDLNLTRRAVKASALTAGEHDENLDKIEGAFDDLNIQGTWVTDLICGTSGSISLHAAGDTLNYTKIVNRMFFSGQINVAAVSSPMGSLEFELPIAVPSLPKGLEISGGNVGYSGILPIGTAGALVLYLNAAGTTIKIVEQTTSGFLDNVASRVQAGAYFWFDFNVVLS